MKMQVKEKDIRNGYGQKISVCYCGAQFLLSNHSPVAYTCGVYGWNFDIYQIDGVTICTGYRRMVGKPANYSVLREFENRARAIRENHTLPYETRSAEIEKLLHEWIETETA